MHELCEYNKGEGFSEGFDAHLNIEQMNKTSVELFQMYTDHRKKGIVVPTEKEFRGYYALLKLDRHPGYKVPYFSNSKLDGSMPVWSGFWNNFSREAAVWLLANKYSVAFAMAGSGISFLGPKSKSFNLTILFLLQ